MRSSPASLAAIALLTLAAFTSTSAQAPAPAPQAPPMPRPYPGVRVLVPGIFVTPVPNAPFTAKVDIISHEILPDGSVNVRTSIAHVARSSSDRIYNERRALVPASFQAEPVLLSALIYDPNNRLSTFYEPATHLARARFCSLPAPPTPSPVPRLPITPTSKEQIGTQPPRRAHPHWHPTNPHDPRFGQHHR